MMYSNVQHISLLRPCCLLATPHVLLHFKQLSSPALPQRLEFALFWVLAPASCLAPSSLSPASWFTDGSSEPPASWFSTDPSWYACLGIRFLSSVECSNLSIYIRHPKLLLLRFLVSGMSNLQCGFD